MERFQISNFRKVRDSWDFKLAPITFFTGKNSSGKSTVLKAMMVLNDYVNSDNHFFMSFDGEFYWKHSVPSFDEAKNWYNKESKEIRFEYENNGNKIELIFEDSNDIDYYVLKREMFGDSEIDLSLNDKVKRGILKFLRITRKGDKATFQISRISRWDYQIEVDAHMIQYIHKSDGLEIEEESSLDREISKFLHKVNASFNIPTIKVLSDLFLVSVSPMIRLSRNWITILNEGRKLLELKKKRDEQIAKHKNIQKYSPQFNLAKQFDNKNLSLGSVVIESLLNYFEVVDDDLGAFDKKSDTRKLLNFASWINDQVKFEIHHLSPNRANQNKIYDIRNREVDINNLLYEYNKSPILNSISHSIINEGLKNFEIDFKFKINPIEENLFAINLFNENVEIDLKDQGYGVGQLFVIFFQVALAIKSKLKNNYRKEDKKQIILIEEPESNLHPKLQSKLADFFYNIYMEHGIYFMIETHSEYVIRKSQLLNLKNKIFRLYYFGNNGPYEMEYRENGRFSRNFGEGFFDEAAKLAIQSMKFAKSQKG